MTHEEPTPQEILDMLSDLNGKPTQRVHSGSTGDGYTFVASGFDVTTGIAGFDDGEMKTAPVFAFEVLGTNEHQAPDDCAPREVVSLILTEEAVRIILYAIIQNKICPDLAGDIKMIVEAHEENCGKPCAS